MGQSIQSTTDMVSYAGDLRRSARHEQAQETAQKIQQAADRLEKTAFERLSLTGPNIGKLLDTLA
ncbi:MAG: hypothetical protein H6924_00195 [Alphaproteobacteria bacterium]|nr:hypothetical protein [Alphaproteobacteria bacterium]